MNRRSFIAAISAAFAALFVPDVSIFDSLGKRQRLEQGLMNARLDQLALSVQSTYIRKRLRLHNLDNALLLLQNPLMMEGLQQEDKKVDWAALKQHLKELFPELPL